MSYLENPKTKGSGIICVIPQEVKCPINCPDCFFQSGRSYLEPLKENLPNMLDRPLRPYEIVRVNDGNDSNHQRDLVIESTNQYKGRRFFNTSRPIPFDEPWVLTINPAEMTDRSFHVVKPSQVVDLMFVRIRVNLWNYDLTRDAVGYYTDLRVPIVLTFLAYHDQQSIPKFWLPYYSVRKRTSNPYYCLNALPWHDTMSKFSNNPLVHSCSGADDLSCAQCGTCVREFLALSSRNSLDK